MTEEEHQAEYLKLRIGRLEWYIPKKIHLLRKCNKKEIDDLELFFTELGKR